MMFTNNLDPEVAEHPDKLVVYGGAGGGPIVARLRCDRLDAPAARARRDAARAERSSVGVV